MTTKTFRMKQSFLRNEFEAQGKWNIPIIKKEELDVSIVDLISFSDTKSNELDQNINKGVHFFIDDYRMDSIYRDPERSLKKLSQYRFICTPDYSLYLNMPKAIQIFNVFRNRWCGAFWQKHGLKVIPTISWSDITSYDFCFDGISENSIVAISTIGCKKEKTNFLRGFNAMIERINPSHIICLGNPFDEMKGNLIVVDYIKSRRVDRYGR